MLNLDVVRQLANGPAPHPSIDGRIVSPSVLLQLVDAIEEGRAAQAELAHVQATRPPEVRIEAGAIRITDLCGAIVHIGAPRGPRSGGFG